MREKKTLHEQATRSDQRGALRLRFHTLGNYGQTQSLGNTDHGFHEPAGELIGVDCLNERLVQFDRVHVQAMQITQR